MAPVPQVCNCQAAALIESPAALAAARVHVRRSACAGDGSSFSWVISVTE